MKRFVVVGIGNFGASVAETLHSLGHDVAALDRDADRVDQLAPVVSRAAAGDGTDIHTLRRIGAEEADGAVISTGDDITASALTALLMRDLDVERIFVKVVSHDHARLIEKIGVTEVIFPERESGIWLAKRISSGSLLGYVELGMGLSLQEMAVPASWVGRSLRELELPRRLRVSVVAVHDVLMDRIRPVPEADAPLTDSDVLLIVGREDDLASAARIT